MGFLFESQRRRAVQAQDDRWMAAKERHDWLVENGLLDPDQPTEWATLNAAAVPEGGDGDG